MLLPTIPAPMTTTLARSGSEAMCSMSSRFPGGPGGD